MTEKQIKTLVSILEKRWNGEIEDQCKQFVPALCMEVLKVRALKRELKNMLNQFYEAKSFKVSRGTMTKWSSPD